MTTAYPGHSINTIKRRIKDQVSGFSEVVNVTIPEAVEGYNTYMGGVDKTDQFICYNRILRKTVRYWKTMFYHLLEIIVTNSSILYNWNRMTAGMKRVSQTQFRDTIVQQIISRYGNPVVARESFTISHGSIYNDEHSKKRCALCRIQNTIRQCHDCHYQPPLCQIRERDCHSIWHSETSSLVNPIMCN